ncbi:MAG: hypothetical protein M1838_005729 [Thelocarpon superellum]|nr:MAG: hypothetical protein M1838_005729 [Thelocarpon superellum]
MFTFTPLLGAQSLAPASQSLLELDGGVKILIDVGWKEDFNPEELKALERQVPTVSIVLLTHATPAHIAAFAHCCKHFPLFTRIPIYATTPVISLGRTLLQDLYASTPLASTVVPSSQSDSGFSYTSSLASDNGSKILLAPPTSEEIASYFSLIHPLKYSQPHQPLGSPFTPPLNGLTITAYGAGYTLGGTIWHIQHGLESIVYAVDWNQARENVLAGASWLGGAGTGGAEVIEQLRKPTALVCSSRGAEKVALAGGRKKRDELLLDMIRTAVTKGGTVLIPTDSSARVLELAYLLEHAWRAAAADVAPGNPLKATKLYLAGRNIGATVRYARSMLEWMDENIVREMEAEGTAGARQQPNRPKGHPRGAGTGPGNDRSDGAGQSKSAGPFDFRHLKLLERPSQIERILKRAADGLNSSGKVILASDNSLAWGFSKDVLRQIAGDKRNLVILTERLGSMVDRAEDAVPTLRDMLWQWWEERGDGVAVERASDGEVLEQVYLADKELEFSHAHRVPLEGNDTILYQQYLATQRQLQNTLSGSDVAARTSAADAIDDTSSSTSTSTDLSDSERQGKALNISTTLGHSSKNKINLTDEDLGINVLLRRKGVYDYDVRGKKGRERIFPFVMKRRRGDEFGEFIRVEDFLKAEERDEAEDEENHTSPASASKSLGQKRKWNDVGRERPIVGRPGETGPNKRRQNVQGRGSAIEPDSTKRNEATEVDTDEDEDESEAETDVPAIVGPAKLVFAKEVVRANLRIAFVDFTGVHDKRSLQMLVPLIAPRKLILVGGQVDETLSLAADCRKLLSANAGSSVGRSTIDVFTPTNGTSVDASVDTNAWMVKLGESLAKQLHWQNVRGLGVVHVTGVLAPGLLPEVGDELQRGRPKKAKLALADGPTTPTTVEVVSPVEQVDAPAPVLDMLPATMAATTRMVAQPLHVGDLRLADLRKVLQGSGHTAEFRGEGTLLIDGFVVVKKTGTGQVAVEGGGLTLPASVSRSRGREGSFYAVKRKIYEGLAIVAGG